MVNKDKPAEPSTGCDERTALVEEARHLGFVKDDDGVDANSPTEDPLLALRRRIHALSDDEAPTALCLSGGGIRSATFSLGVLQGLARKRALDKFHYLSTVSGGGYIGSWLSSWIRRDSLQNVTEALAQPRSFEPFAVRQLRAYSNYLSPTVGLSGDFLTLVATFLRNLLLNWLIFLPLLIAFLMLPRLHLALIETAAHLDAGANPPSPDAVILGLMALLGAIAVTTSIAYASSDLPGQPPKEVSNEFYRYCLAPLILAAMTLSWLVVSLLANEQTLAILKSQWTTVLVAAAGAVLHAVGTLIGRVWRRKRGITEFPAPDGQRAQRACRKSAAWLLVCVTGAAGGLFVLAAARHIGPWAELSDDARIAYAALAVPVLLMGYWLTMTVLVGLSRPLATEDDREWWARASGAIVGGAVAWTLLFGLVYFIPSWLLRIPWLEANKTTAVSGSVALSVGVALIGYWSRNGATVRKNLHGITTALGVRLLDLASLVAILILVISLVLLTSWSLGQVTSSIDVDTLAEVRLENNRKAIDYVNNCITLPRASLEAQNACRKAAAAAKELAAYSKWASAASAAPAACAKAIEMHGLSDPVSESFAAYQAQADARQRCSTLTTLAAEGAYGPSAAGWLQLTHEAALLSAPAWLLAASILVFGLFAWSLSASTGCNAFSLHAMYCNRLVRAYLGATRDTSRRTKSQPRQPHWLTGFDPKDNLSLHQSASGGSNACGTTSMEKTKLFHVINAALNVVRPAGGRLEWQERKAISFTMTPLHCGTRNRGYAPTDRYAGKDGMTVGRAMAISGAAASPNMGYHSSPLVSFLMALFNVRLGWWLPSAGPKTDPKTGIKLDQHKLWERHEPSPTSFPLLSEMLGRTTDDTDFVYVSDGGHFENLGLYEMVRRRCRRILVVDAGCDPDYQYGDLANALRKIRTDFGVDIEFSGPLPGQTNSKGRHFAIGRIRYSALVEESFTDTKSAKRKVPRDGVVVLIKPFLCGKEPLDVLRYRDVSKNRRGTFPQQPTSDQFFDESQFESYRVLGLHSIDCDHGPFEAGGEWPSPPAPFVLPTESAAPHPDAAETQTQTIRDSSQHSTATKSLMDIVRSVDPAALVASTVALGGIVGVTGTVALRDSRLHLENPELRLSTEDRTLLSDLAKAVLAGERDITSPTIMLAKIPGYFGVMPVLFEAAGVKDKYWRDPYQTAEAWLPYSREENVASLTNPDLKDDYVWKPKDGTANKTDGVSRLSDIQVRYIETLIDRLANCEPDRYPIEIEVLGFASSRDFERPIRGPDGRPTMERHKQSDRLNVLVSYARGMTVYNQVESSVKRLLKTRFPSADIRLRKPAMYESAAMMQNERRLIDQFDGLTWDDKEALTRRAEIRIVHAGRCSGITDLKSAKKSE